MAKDYHKGVKLQCYISEELNEQINEAIDYVNRAICSEDPDIYTRTTLVNEAIRHYLEHITS